VSGGIRRVLSDSERAGQLASSAARLAADRYSESAYMTELERALAGFSAMRAAMQPRVL
jgi:hypothetical protein